MTVKVDGTPAKQQPGRPAPGPWSSPVPPPRAPPAATQPGPPPPARVIYLYGPATHGARSARDQRCACRGHEAHFCARLCCCCCQTAALALLTVCVVLVVLAAIAVIAAFSLVGYPWHASCKADWTFGKPCADVRTSIQHQMEAWAGPDNCAQGGERCLYEITSMNNKTIIGTHTTPTNHYVDELNMVFMESSDDTCRMQGYSRSKTWYAYLDDGTNYCNMRNLISGAALDKDDSQFSESTSDSQCTQYSSADCNKY